jgi:hypothetical protein
MTRLRLTLITLASWFTLSAVWIPSGDAQILFARDTPVPRPVQVFAWHVIETRCDYRLYGRGLRSFWAYRAQAIRGTAAIVYSIEILADLSWRKREPSAMIKMGVVDDGSLRLTSLDSSFITCTP